MMEPAEDRDWNELSADLGDRPRCTDRCSLAQALMGPSAIEVDLAVLFQNAAQLALAEYDHLAEALPAHRTKKSLADGLRLGERGGLFTTSIAVPSATAANRLPNLRLGQVAGRSKSRDRR